MTSRSTFSQDWYLFIWHRARFKSFPFSLRIIMCGIFNFSKEAKQYPAPFIDDAKYRVLLNTDWERFSGGTKEEAESYSKGEIILLPPYSGILFCRVGDEVTEKEQQ